VNGVGRMIGFDSRRRRELLIGQGAARSKGTANRGVGPGCFQPGSGLSFSPRLILAFWT
jgi:hypothetical protein